MRNPRIFVVLHDITLDAVARGQADPKSEWFKKSVSEVIRIALGRAGFPVREVKMGRPSRKRPTVVECKEAEE